MDLFRTLYQWWLLRTCAGRLRNISKDSPAAVYLATTRGVDIGTLQDSDLSFFEYCKRYPRCTTCPRFQAYRQGLALSESGLRNLHVGGAIRTAESEVRDRDGERTQVHDCQQNARPSITTHAEICKQADAHSVAVDRSPRVDDAQHRTHQGNGERDGLKHCGIHAQIVQHGHALPTVTAWLAGITIALLIGCAHYLDDIDDHSAENAQAVDLQAAIVASIAQERFDRAAQAVCGPQAAWVQLNDGSVQCSTKYGKPTITVRVSP